MSMEKDYVWFNQKYFYHKDSEFNQDGGSLEISVNSNTTDFQNYSTPTLNVSVFNNKVRYNVNLKYQDIIDLLFSFDEIKANINDIYNNGGTEIKKILNGKNFKLGFKKSQNTGKRAVLFLVANSATDFGVIVISYNIFLSIVELFKSFKKDYIKIPFEISNRASLSYILDELKEIKEFNKSLPSSIVNLTSNERIHNSDDLNTVNKLSDLSDGCEDDEPPWDIDDDKQRKFEDFIENNIDSIKVPDLDKISNKIEEKQNSFFIDNILKNDIKNLDSFLVSLTTHSNPIEKFREIIGEHMNTTLPSITDNELKSACYYSKRFFLYNIQNYIRNHIQIPTSIPIIKYKPNEFNDENIDLAYDLLTLSMYIRLVKDKLINKIDDASINKSLLYTSLRVYTDIFTFSFLDDIDHDMITKCVMNRFKNYSNRGVFNSFDELLKQYDFPKINEIEMNNFITQIVSRVVGENKTLSISELHRKEYDEDKIKLPYSNEFDLDKITKEFVKAEIELKLEIINTKANYSDDVLKMLNIGIKKEEQSDFKEDNDDWVGSIMNNDK